jgi:peptide/nickel transport system ATP-binding protein
MTRGDRTGATAGGSTRDRPVLSVRDLRTEFDTDDGRLTAVDGVSFDVHAGETVCLVGESGCGKTVTCESITGLSVPLGRVTDGTVRFRGTDLVQCSDRDLREVRGAGIAHVFQNPQGALDPVYAVGEQITEAIHIHRDVSDRAARDRAADLLDRVGIPDPSARFDDYPHELSGGMQQRVAIAVALAADPDLLVADEPTTALDVTIQASVLSLFRELQAEREMATLFVTHDLGVVAEVADRVVVMYGGKVMERGPVGEVLSDPAHPYTRALLECLPGRAAAMTGIPGDVPDPADPPHGCRFHPRCPHAVEACRTGAQPPRFDVDETAADGREESTHDVSCVHYEGGKARANELRRDPGETDPPGEQVAGDGGTTGGERGE